MPSDLSDGELTDDLLALVDNSKKKNKRHHRSTSSGGKPAKRHKRQHSSASEDEAEDEPESEEDASNPYPLEGQYVDEADRIRLMEMGDLEREQILTARAEEMQKFQDSYNLNEMFKAQTAAAASGGGTAEDNNVSSAAKRKHTQRGATKEKADKLSEYKAKRKAKDDRRKAGKDKSSSPRRATDSDDMEISSEEEDGEINKDQQLEERARNAFEKKEKVAEPPIEIADAQKVVLRRDHLTKYYDMPWFDEYLKGAFVRYLIGQEGNEAIYRLCEITALATDTVKPYDVAGKMMNQQIELRHGKHVKFFNMDKVSNSGITQREFDRFMKVNQYEKLPLPTKSGLEKKQAQMKKLIEKMLTESDINAILARKNNLQPARGRKQNIFSEKSKLVQERKLALAREDYKEAEMIDAKIRAMEETEAPKQEQQREPDTNDLMAKVNERNRQRNLEGIRKAEAEAALRKRMERKALASGTATPPIGGLDPSARVRTVPKLFNNRSRAGTPNGATTPNMQADTMRSVSPIPPLAMPAAATTSGKVDFAAKIMNVEIDLGDF